MKSGPSEVVAVLHALVREQAPAMSVGDVVREVMLRVGCSRRTAYRGFARAVAAGRVRLPRF